MKYSYLSILGLAFLSAIVSQPAIAQSITAADGGTTINVVGNRSDITGNQVSGINQFHSFTNFNVDAGKTANFIPNNVNIQNILSRVTGGTPSQIQGIIQGSSGVNLFLMNPSGILFGNGASLNVPGSFTATTANAIGFGNNNWFNGAGNNNFANLTNTPNQFAFTSANPGAIVNTGNLAVPSGNSINLVGGTVINTGTIATSSGYITIAAVEGGKAVQITPGNSLLSYVLPIEALNAINPAIGNPVSLPELLTGNPLDSASGIEIKNGVITLIKSQTQFPDRSGLAVIDGKISTILPNTGNIEVVGKTIAIIKPTIESKFINLTASDRILFEDLDGNKLKLGNSIRSLIMQTTSTNGVIEALNPKDSLVVPGSIAITSDIVNLGNIQASASQYNNIGLHIGTRQDMTIGDLTVNPGAIELISTNGNIKAGRLFSQNSTPTTLTANLGNIEVNSIEAGGFIGADPETDLALDVFAGGTFRAVGTTQDSYDFSVRNADNSVLQFLAQKTGKTVAEVQAVLQNGTKPKLDVLSPVSILINNRSLRIRYAGGTGPELNPLTGITLQGDKGRFESGTKETLGMGDPYVPLDKNQDFKTFIAQPFDITKNATYQTIVISNGASGTIGAIVRNTFVDGSLSIGLQDQTFGMLSTKPDPNPNSNPKSNSNSNPNPNPKSNSNVSPIDLENRTASTLAACPKSQTIALLPTEASRSPDSTTPKPTAKNPCIPDNSDDEILKILK
jgi:filamentous hemagglutinin family protein